jgi:hypothetical protein
MSIGCVRCIELVAASYPLHAGRFSELLQKFQVEVTGYAKDMRDSKLTKTS